MDAIQYDEANKIQNRRFVDTYSHGQTDFACANDLSSLSETTNVLKSLLDMIKSVDKEHYESMTELIEG